MQERAAVAFAAFFLVIVVAAGAVSAVATPPSVTVDDPAYVLTTDDEFTVDGRTYTVTGVEGDAGTVAWVLQDVEFSETWDDGSTVDLDNTTYEVTVDANATPSLSLVEARELPDDVETVDANGSQYVVLGSGDNRTFVPREDYLTQEFGEPDRLTLGEGDSLDYQGERATVASIDNASATVTWTADQTDEKSLDHQQIETLGPDNDVQFAVHVEGNRLLLADDVAGYNAQVAAVDRFHDRMTGLLYVAVLGVVGFGIVVVLSFIPVRRT